MKSIKILLIAALLFTFVGCGSSEEKSPTTTVKKTTTTTEAVDIKSFEGLCQKIRKVGVKISDDFTLVGKQFVSNPNGAVESIQTLFKEIAPELEEIKTLLPDVELPTNENEAELKEEAIATLDEISILLADVSSKLELIPQEERTLENLTAIIQPDFTTFAELTKELATSVSKLKLDSCYQDVSVDSGKGSK
jgi:hypothetical protein